jgi:hypothetical protein
MSKAGEEIQKNLLERVQRMEEKIKRLQTRLREKNIPDLKEEDFLKFVDVLESVTPSGD